MGRDGNRRTVIAALPALLLAVLLSWPAGRADTQHVVWWTTTALDKVRPDRTAPENPERAARLAAARNEFESFQIVLLARDPVARVDVEVSDLSGPEGALIPAAKTAIYLVRNLSLKTPSSDESGPGEWPDPLVPRVDRYAHERRNAFPFALKPGRAQAVWIELYVPPNTPPGQYRGEARVLVDDQQFAVPIELEVWNFALPSTSSLKTSFGFNGLNALKQHFGKYTNDGDLRAMVHAYGRAALLHRISIHGGALAPPRWKGNGLDFSGYEQEMGPLLDGTILEKEDPLPGAQATSADIRLPTDLPEDEAVKYFRAWAKHFQKRGMPDRLFYYLWDEPPLADYPKVVAKGRPARRAGEVRSLVTAPLHHDLAAVTDIWAPVVNCFENKAGLDRFCPETVGRRAYDRELREGKSLWWYQSCCSHGCNIIGGEYFRGWPSYMIDANGVANRIFQWLAWKYRIGGELYFSMNEAFGRDVDPWEDVHMHGGNGDGTLFYPGRPAQIGGATPIPVDSIRLKLIREGLEDYEYLALLARSGQERFAAETVDRMAKRTYQFDRRPQVLYELRRAMGERLNGRAPD